MGEAPQEEIRRHLTTPETNMPQRKTPECSPYLGDFAPVEKFSLVLGAVLNNAYNSDLISDIQRDQIYEEFKVDWAEDDDLLSKRSSYVRELEDVLEPPYEARPPPASA